jgi:hypothetical protein
VAAHPLQAELEAADLTVSPPLPLLKKPQADKSRVTFLPLQAGHSGSDGPITRYSNSRAQV